MRSITKPAAVVIFFLLSLAPVALFGQLDPWNAAAGFNHGKLAPFPPNFAPNTFRRIGRWFDERIGLRYPLIMLGNDLRSHVWQPRWRGEALYGRNGWLFYNDNERLAAPLMADLRGRVRIPDADATRFDRQLADIGARVAACGKAAFIVVAPNKQTIYPEHLRAFPDGQPPSRLDRLVASLSPASRSMFIDLRPDLKAAKDREPGPIYYRTDTHWNQVGALVAYGTIAARLAAQGLVDRSDILTLDRFAIGTRPFVGGDIAVQYLFSPHRFAEEHPTLTSKSGDDAAFPIHDGVDNQTIVNPRGRGNLLVIGDSFSWSLARLLARHFHRTTVLTRPLAAPVFDGAWVDRFAADVTILEVVERNLTELLPPPRNLDRTCGG